MGASVTDIGKPIFESSALGDLGDVLEYTEAGSGP